MSDRTKDADWPQRLKEAKRLAALLVTERRQTIPLRAEFVRDVNARPNDGPPDTKLRELVRRGGSDGLLLKLYLALIWRCSAPPFDTEISARLWSNLLALPSYEHNVGARRVSKALTTLQDLNLVKLERISGDSSRVTLLHESGDGSAYTLPFGGRNPDAYYLRVPVELWTSGKMHELGTPGVAMLLALLAEQPKNGGEVWWSTRRFESRIGLSVSTRTRGTKELVAAKVLFTRRGQRPNDKKTFAPESTVTIYKLQGEAAPTPAQQKKTIAAAKRK
ncbi:hypothetical protein [Gordonia polyisoprenivorans]|uniref:hypothetical protein n=1 Tax=Gordonia polyisoprenivorans TaxID=84595 RepID=UPI000372A204|nr:hypothetical protein [Gordonia polyisoprenivorans]